MSVKQMALVWEHDFDHAEQSVMLALADHAHDDGTEIRPSVARLAWKTGYESRQVQRILKHLRDDLGILVLVSEGGGRGKPNVYRFDWTNGVKKSPFKSKRVTLRPEKGDTAMTPEPSSIEPSSVEAKASRGIAENEVSPDSPDVFEKMRMIDAVEAELDTQEPEPKVIGLEKHVVDRIYTTMDKAGYTLDGGDTFKYHLGRAKAMLAKMNPTDEELEWIPAAAVAHFEIKSWTDAMSALRYMRQQKARRERLAADKDGSLHPSYYDQLDKSVDKPRSPLWYASTHEADYETVARWIKEGLGHSEIEKRLESGAVA